MKSNTAVLVELGKPIVFAELEIPVLKPGQVLVEVVYSGLCHTQILECRGYRGHDPYLPHCLGHEGSGIVREISSGVEKVKPGDEVVLSWIKGSGADISATIYKWQNKQVNAGAVTTLGQYSVISENRLTLLPDGISMRDAALLGCAVPTGVGSVIHTANAQAGQSIAVFGTGGVGLCAIEAAAAVGCAPIIAVDIRADKLLLAKQVGATNLIDASKEDTEKEIGRLCPKGLDFSIEATGRPEVMARALSCVRARGGTTVVIGNAREGERMSLDPKELNMGKRLLGTWGGDSNPDRDTPRYCRMILDKKLDLKPLCEKEYPFSSVNQAIDDLEAGRSIRPLIRMGEA